MQPNELTTYICLFHSQDHAEAALNALESAGFSRNAVSTTWKNGQAAGYDYGDELTRLGVPDRDLEHFRDGLAKGGVVLSLEAPESSSDDIERIFHKYSAKKVDETDLDRAEPAAFVAPVPRAGALAAEGAVVPVVAEELLVGKREVDRGGVRVFRRTVEEPVSESVSLHEERVVVERRPVDRAVTGSELETGDRTIELIETAEVPVVSKVARVVEEVRVGVVGSDRTERVEDTVRHTEVELEELPQEGYTEGSRGTSGTGKL